MYSCLVQFNDITIILWLESQNADIIPTLIIINLLAASTCTDQMVPYFPHVGIGRHMDFTQKQ
jgi:hypothetical protein